MNKLFYSFLSLASGLAALAWPQPLLQADTLASRLSGRILIQVEQRGEAWYLNPLDGKRYFLGRPADAFALMRSLGLGISETDWQDLSIETKRRLAGRILLRVQSQGQAYYINPLNLELRFLGRPADAFALMRSLGLGITNNDLSRLPLGRLPVASQASTPASTDASLEKSIHELINQERRQNGLGDLKWNDQVAAVAREHSQNQAAENRNLIGTNRLCSYPLIHHEGQVFGLYHAERLNQRQVYYFGASAENIALIPEIKSSIYESQSGDEMPSDCQGEVNRLNQAYENAVGQATGTEAKLAVLRQEISLRSQRLAASPVINIIEQAYSGPDEISRKAVAGWMNSPGHRKNILNGAYDEAGIGLASVNGYVIITQVFIKRASCGYQGGDCCQKPGYYPYCYLPLTCRNDLCSKD